MNTIAVILTTIFKKEDNLRALLNDLLIQSKRISEVSISFQRSQDNYYKNADVYCFLKDFNELNVLYEIMDELNTSSGRNVAIAKTKADWIINVDDDCRFYPDSVEKVLGSIEQNQKADVLTFRSKRPSKSFKTRSFEHTRFSIKGVSLIEIVFKRKILSILGSKPYDERFGLGARWETGEEQILLNDIIKKGGKIIYVPEVIVAHEEESSGYLLKPSVIKAKGAMFRRMYGYFGLFIAMLFVFKKAVDGTLNTGILQSLLLVLEGFTEFREHEK